MVEATHFNEDFVDVREVHFFAPLIVLDTLIDKRLQIVIVSLQELDSFDLHELLDRDVIEIALNDITS